MFDSVSHFLFRYFRAIARSIAYYPTLVAIAFLVLSFVMLNFEQTQFADTLKEQFPQLLITDPQTARLILSALIGGMISLTVFSFSMVMVVINRASSTLSPRVIPGLISQKNHQFTLGIYIGTIIYCLIVTTNIRQLESQSQVPASGIFLAIIFGVINLALFVYFIHSISKSVQVDNILQSIYRSTMKLIEDRHQYEQAADDTHGDDQQDENRGALKSKDERAPQSLCDSDTDQWYTVKSSHSGYFKATSEDRLVNLLKEHDLQLAVLVDRGFFTMAGHPLFKVSDKIDDELQDQIGHCFVFFVEEFAEDHYLYGFKQIREIAVKALSPGINDPGTAVKAIDLLSLLFKEYLSLKYAEVICDDEQHPRIFYWNTRLDQLLFETFTPILQYGEKDLVVMANFFQGLKNIFYGKVSDENQNTLVDYVEDSYRHVVNQSESHADLDYIRKHVRKVNKLNTISREIQIETET